jgi:metal-sulfur cluster biosynthetic enzyme
MIDKELIIANLKNVYDPEMEGVSVYDLGLIYDIKINAEDLWVEITHTLTSAFCPFADQMVADITKAGYVADVLNVEVITTFDPPFTMDMVPEETKMMMGW